MASKRGAILFDWGNTLMREFAGYEGPMAVWPRVVALPGAAEVLAALQPDWTLCLATNALGSDAAQIRAALARAKLDAYIERIFRGIDLGAQKPHPAFFAGALAQLGEPAERVVMVGDGFEVDVLGAANAGLRAVWLNEHTAESREGPLWRTIHRLADLPAALASFAADRR